MSANTSNSKKGTITGVLIRSAIVAALGGLLFGFDTAVISGATASITNLMELSTVMLGVIVASALVGTVFGTFSLTQLAIKWGRRTCLVITAALFAVSAIGSALAWDEFSLIVFRFIGGVGVGASSVFGPMYIAEISPARLRGRMVMIFQYNVCWGVLIAYLTNAVIRGFGLDALQVEWRVMFGIETLPALLFLVTLLTVPRSPRWLVSKGRSEEALQVLKQIGEDDPEFTLKEIEEAESKDALQPATDTAEALFQQKYAYAIFLGVAVAAFNQLSFVNGYLYYLKDTLDAIGATFGGNYQPVLIGTFSVVASTMAIFTIDYFGRRKLLMIGSWGAGLPLLLCSYIAWTGEMVELFPWALGIFIMFFSYSQGSVIWVYLSEVFPDKVRAKGQSLGSFTHWGLCAAAAFVYPTIFAISPGFPFFFGAVTMLVQFFLVRQLFVETNGVTLEEIEKKLGLAD